MFIKNNRLKTSKRPREYDFKSKATIAAKVLLKLNTGDTVGICIYLLLALLQ